MTDKIADQPEGATPLDDISGLLREDIARTVSNNLGTTMVKKQ